MMRHSFRPLAAILLLLAATWPTLAQDEAPAAIAGDVEVLTQHPHRLAGTDEAQAAAAHIEARLKALGVPYVMRLDLPVMQTVIDRCDIEVDGKRIDLLPLRPNILVPPVTPQAGITGPMIYVGKGELEDYGKRDPSNAIVVMDYDSRANWEKAVAMGASAVILLETGRDDSTGKHAPLPANFIRLFASREAQEAFDFTQDRSSVTLTSHIRWEQRVASNVLAFIPGTAPVFDAQAGKAQMVVLSTPFDTFGNVPRNSPGARQAANVASLIRTAGMFAAQPAKRDVVVAFFDNHSRGRQGVRQFYGLLKLDDATFERVRNEHVAEQRYMQRLRDRVEDGFDAFDASPRDALYAAVIDHFKQFAQFHRDDLNSELAVVRLADIEEDVREARIASLKQQMAAWDMARRELNKPSDTRDLTRLEESIRQKLCRTIADLATRRAAQLDIEVAIDSQAALLRQRLQERDIILHLSWNLSDAGPRWGMVLGDSTSNTVGRFNQNTDKPGAYARVLQALSRAAASAGELQHLDPQTLTSLWYGRTFVDGTYVSDGLMAGVWGIYNLSVMTGFDARQRDGHPTDTLAALDIEAIDQQAREVDRFLQAAMDEPTLGVPQGFASVGTTLLRRWNIDRQTASGFFVGLQVSGSLKEHRPAADAVLAAYPMGSAAKAWPFDPPSKLADMTAYEYAAIVPLSTHGHYNLIGIAEDKWRNHVGLAANFDATGQVTGITNAETLINASGWPDTRRIDIFPGRGFVVPFPWLAESKAQPMQVNQAISDAPFRNTQQLSGHAQGGSLAFFYVPNRGLDGRLKVYHPSGMAILNVTEANPLGVGLPVDTFKLPVHAGELTAVDLYEINEQRLRVLRTRGITEADLEMLHGRAGQWLERVERSDTQAARVAGLAESEARSRRLHTPLRGAMNDLVRAIVMLLLLAIPFSFALERLLVGAAGVYARLAGFAAIFAITFVVLYILHPGFAIAATPTIIFLAFIIVLLSSLVIYIVVRKFRTELREAQGQSSRLHAAEMSKMGTVIAAANMGISTMRRRPLRTTLTAVTVIMLTFTILCFATFGSRLGVARTYVGPAIEGQNADVFLRRLDYQAMDPRMVDVLKARAGEAGHVATQYWMVRTTATEAAYSVVNAATGKSAVISGIMGLDPAELPRWPALAEVLDGVDAESGQRALASDGVFLPRFIRDELDLEVGAAIRVRGRAATFAGVLEPRRIQQLSHLDAESVLPVDFTDESAAQTDADKLAAASGQDEMDLTQRDYVRLSPDQIAIAGADFTRQLGGKLHLINLYYGDPTVDVAQQGDEIAELASLSVWARSRAGVNRLIFTSLAELSGGMALIVPVVLGGLIIFGTMLGSIADREKEIYTFSALGLAPAHVGLLFFAEAAVYAVVGGMGGQILAQGVMAVASMLAEAGVIDPPAINFSSTNALFAMGIVMATVMISAIYPAMRASRSANPGLARTWRMPPAEGDDLKMVFPFTVSAYDITGVVSFLAEHFKAHDDAGLGGFASQRVEIGRRSDSGALELDVDVALAPFDLGVTQRFTLTATPSEIPGVDEVAVHAHRTSGAAGDWTRANKVFLHDLRRQFLLWRTLSHEMIEQYRGQTLMALGELEDERTLKNSGGEATDAFRRDEEEPTT